MTNETKDTTLPTKQIVLWKRLPGSGGSFDFLKLGATVTIGAVCSMPWPPDCDGSGWALSRYRGNAKWEPVSEVEYPPNDGLEVVFDGEMWHWEGAPEHPQLVPFDELLTWLKEIEEKCMLDTAIRLQTSAIRHAAFKKWGGGLAEEEVDRG